MRVHSKTIVWSWLGLILLICIMIVGAYSKLNPSSLIEMLEHKVSQVIPGSTLKVDKVSYGIALDFKLALRDITLLRNKKNLIEAKKIELKIPWWLILLNRGDIHLSVEDMNLFLSDSEAKELSLEQSNVQVNTDKVIELAIPEYLINAMYSIRGKNLNIKSEDGSRNYLSLTRFVVKDFKLDKNSAFEVNMPVTINHQGQQIKSELWVFGDVTPGDSVWNINYRGEFKTVEISEKLRIEDIVLSGGAAFTPAKYQVNSALDLTIDKVKVGEGTIFTNDTKSDLVFSFDKLPVSYLDIFLPASLKIHNVSSPVMAKLKVQKTPERDNAFEINFEVSFEDQFKVSDKKTELGEWHFSSINKIMNLRFISKDKSLHYVEKSDGMTEKREIKVNQYPLADLTHLFPKEDELARFSATGSETKIEFKGVSHNDQLWNGNLIYKNHLESISLLLTASAKNSKLDLKYLKKNESFKTEAHFKMAPGLWIDPLFKSAFSAPDSMLDGYVKGDWQNNWELGIWDVKLSLSGNPLVDGSISQKMNSLFELFSLEKEFKKVVLDTKIHKGKIDFKNQFFTKDDQFQLSGILSENPVMKSHAILDYPKNKSWKATRKEINEIFWRDIEND